MPATILGPAQSRSSRTASLKSGPLVSNAIGRLAVHLEGDASSRSGGDRDDPVPRPGLNEDNAILIGVMGAPARRWRGDLGRQASAHVSWRPSVSTGVAPRLVHWGTGRLVGPTSGSTFAVSLARTRRLGPKRAEQSLVWARGARGPRRRRCWFGTAPFRGPRSRSRAKPMVGPPGLMRQFRLSSVLGNC